jgi:hypothetical protein
MPNPNGEFFTLPDWLRTAVSSAVASTLSFGGRRAIDARDGSEAYAYPGADGKVHWGVNNSDGLCVARGFLKAGERLGGGAITDAILAKAG